MKFEPLAHQAASEPETKLAIRPTSEMAATNPASVIDAEWRPVRARRSLGDASRTRWDRRRSVVLLAALMALAICGVPCLVFFLAEAIAR